MHSIFSSYRPQIYDFVRNFSFATVLSSPFRRRRNIRLRTLDGLSDSLSTVLSASYLSPISRSPLPPCISQALSVLLSVNSSAKPRVVSSPFRQTPTVSPTVSTRNRYLPLLLMTMKAPRISRASVKKEPPLPLVKVCSQSTRTLDLRYRLSRRALSRAR